MKRSVFLLGILLIAGCVSSSGPGTLAPGTREVNRNAVLYQGPELVATVAFLQGKSSVAEEYLVLGVELSGSRGGEPVVVNRDGIWVRTPDGHRLPLLSEEEYHKSYPSLHIAIQRTMAFLPLLYLYHPTQVNCSRWFLVTGFGDIAYDEIPINTIDVCSGPLVFGVPGGVQPGRWRLIIELEESIADIPFVIELDR